MPSTKTLGQAAKGRVVGEGSEAQELSGCRGQGGVGSPLARSADPWNRDHAPRPSAWRRPSRALHLLHENAEEPLRLGLESGLGAPGQSWKPPPGIPGPRTDLPKAEAEIWEGILQSEGDYQGQAPWGCNRARWPKAASCPARSDPCPGSGLHTREGAGAGPQGQGVVAEDRVTGRAGAAGIPTGRGIGSKGQAEVQVLLRDGQQDLV